MSQRLVDRTHHVAILGAGAVGITLATFLRSRGHRVTLLTRDGTARLPVTVLDEIGHRELTLRREDVELRRATDVPAGVDHLIVCTRAEQLEAALAGLQHVDVRVPITNAAATLDDVPALARKLAIPNPLLVMGVGFAAWPTADERYRVFALQPPGPAIAPYGRAGAEAAKELARILAGAGLPASAPPPVLFRWLFRTLLTTQVAWMQSFRRAGWDLNALATQPDLIELCGLATREVAQVVRGGGPIAVVARQLPAQLHAWLVVRGARAASEGFREVWRYHGPKCEDQLALLTSQILAQAGDRAMPALRELARS